MPDYLKILIFTVFALCFSCLSIEGRPLQGGGKRYAYGHGRNYPYRYAYKSGWAGNQTGWSPYYYYGYPRSRLVYQYTYPFDSSYFYSYPSSRRGWTYPSYPYNGTYYVNDTPIPANKYYSSYRSYRSRPPSTTVEVDLSPNIRGTTTGVFLSE